MEQQELLIYSTQQDKKEEMKKLEIDSPNMFDGACMSFANPESVAEVKPLQIKKRKWK